MEDCCILSMLVCGVFIWNINFFVWRYNIPLFDENLLNLKKLEYFPPLIILEKYLGNSNNHQKKISTDKKQTKYNPPDLIRTTLPHPPQITHHKKYNFGSTSKPHPHKTKKQYNI